MSCNYLKSIVSSQHTDKMPCDLSYDYRKLITKLILGNLNFIASLYYEYVL